MADERDRLRRLRALEAEQTVTAPSTKADPYYVRDPKTGLSQAQVDAQKGLQAAQQARTELGLAGVLTTPAGSAGFIDTPPATGLKVGYEWYQAPKAGGGTEWRQRPTRDTLVKSYTTLFSGGDNKGDGGGGGGGGGNDVASLLAAQAAREKLAAEQAAKAALEAKRQAGQSAYNLLFEQFNQYGLGALVKPLEDLIVQGLSPAEFTLRLRDTDAYKKRFTANQQRINRGLRALSEAEYITLEDQYQNIMRNYGLPETYYTRGDMGRQEGFEKFIAGDVSAAELEERIATAQRRVLNAPIEVRNALTQFYGNEISNGDILAYSLDPDKALENIKRKVTAAEIGAGAMQAGLGTTRERAEELGAFGVTGQQARQGFATIAELLPTAQKLSDIYAKQGMGPFTQTTAEQEVFGITGAAEAATKRRRLTQLEQAQFAGQTGRAGSALARERAGAIQAC